MGRHSAPDDDADDGDGGDVATLVDDFAPDVEITGRHSKIAADPDRGVEPERPAERTTVISTAAAQAAADADAVGTPELPMPAAELEPILPGEAIVPPVVDVVDADPEGSPGVLDALLTAPAPTRKWGRRPKPVAEPVVVEPVVVEPVVVEPVAVEPVVEPPEIEPVEADAVAATELEEEVPARPGPARPAPVVEVPVVEASETPAPAAAPAPAPAQPAPAGQQRGHAGGTAADFALLRADPTLRARCVAALLVPFAVYAVVLLVVGAHGVQWLLWIWIPTILAGVVVGVFLDAAHKQAEARPAGAGSVSGS